MSDHRFVVAFVTALLLGPSQLGLWHDVSRAAEAKEPTPHVGGFWKCKTGSKVKGEFGGEDPVGLASRVHIPTDCALHWSDGHGKTYCFASNPSFLEFDSNPDILTRARAFWTAPGPRPETGLGRP